MKSSLKKLKKFAALRNDGRARKQRPASGLDELARAAQNMNDMRECYERLLSAAASAANSVYEFSESLTEMGQCLIEKTAMDFDEESGKVLLMMGKVQFELQQIMDGYRSHIIQTITVPSESLLNELRVVEEMKKRCDDKREICEALKKKHKEKGSLRNSKVECFPSSQQQQFQDEYEDEANAFVFRMKSLKQAQTRSFLTQASRHHAAQISFFRRALRSLEAIEPHVKLLAEQHFIDFQSSVLKDGGGEIFDDYGDERTDGDDSSDESLPSQNPPSEDPSESKKLMEVYGKDAAHSPDHNTGAVKEILESYRNSFHVNREVGALSKSAPLLPGKKLNSAERVPQLVSLPSGKFASYVLPTPDEPSISVSRKLWTEVPQAPNRLNSSGLNPRNSISLDTTKKASILPPPVTEGVSLKQVEPDAAAFFTEKFTRLVFSGPLAAKPGPNFSDRSSITSSALPPLSGPLLRTPLLRSSMDSKPPSSVPPNFLSSLKISELHELPRPPAPGRPPHVTTRSSPPVSRYHDQSTTVSVSKTPISVSALPRSSSVPAGRLMEEALQDLLEESSNLKTAESAAGSSQSKPISVQLIQPASASSLVEQKRYAGS